MSYTAKGIDERAEVQQGTAEDSLVYWPRLQGAGVVPTAAFVTVYEPGGAEKVARVAADIAASGQLSLSQAWPEADYELAEDYYAIWEFTADGVTHADRLYFDVVLNKLPCLIDVEDLLELYPDLELTLQALPTGTTADRFIRRAWSEMLDQLRSAGHRPSLILDKHRLVNPGIHLSLHYVANALTKEPLDLWHERKKDHRKSFDQLFGALGELRYDTDEDGLVGSGETARVNRKNWRV